jgi:hypothetical protein
MNLQSSIVSQFVSDTFYWVFMGILVLNLTQRKYQKTAGKKRMATLYLAIAALAIYSAAQLSLLYELGDGLFAAFAIVVLGAVYVLRAYTFPFTLICQRTGRRLDFHNILYNDSNSLPESDDVEPEDEPDDDQDDR